MSQSKSNFRRIKKAILYASVLCSAVVSFDAFTATALTLGGVASSITGSFANITLLITGGSYLAGIAFSIGAIMKFKQHKDNPTQIPIGTPIALLFIAAALLFLPSVLSTAGMTLFKGGSTSTPTGSVYSPTQG